MNAKYSLVFIAHFLTLLLGYHTTAFAQPQLDRVSFTLTGNSDKFEKCRLSVLSSNNDSATIQVLTPDGTSLGDVHAEDLTVTSPRLGAGSIFRIDSVISSAEPKLWVSFVLDNSVSMFHNYDSLTAYLDYVVRGIHQHFSAVVFDNTLRTTQSLTTAKHDVFLSVLPRTDSSRALRKFWHYYDTIRSDWTPLYDAIYAAIDPLTSTETVEQEGEHLIVAISDGEDNASRIGLTDLGSIVKEKAIRLFAINFRDEPDTRLRWLCKRGHGSYFYADDLKELSVVLQGLKAMLFGAYVIHYRFTGPGAGGVR